MISKYKLGEITWVDVASPTREEIRDLKESYSLPDLLCEELLKRTPRSKADRYKDQIYLVLHFPVRTDKSIREHEIDFVIGKSYVITVHYEPCFALERLTHSIEEKQLIKKSSIAEHPGFLFHNIIREIYLDVMNDLEKINTKIRKIESRIFDSEEIKIVEAISHVNRDLVEFKQALRFHADVLRSFSEAGATFFGSSFVYHQSLINDEYNKIRTVLEGHKEILSDIRVTNDSLISVKTSKTIRFLTSLTFIILLLTLVTGFFAMNTSPQLLLIKTKANLVFVGGAMVLLIVVLIVYFKKKKWL